ncbi:MAG: SLC26A/SulP transporter family protein [Deltaproteobacteria bacterium]|nr:SLC26A/SulP transporter family protein [Deltaproteobacteria bacterium]
MSTAAASPKLGSVPRAQEVWGGLAAALVAFPSSIAFGVVLYSAISPALAGAGALAGIFGAVALGIVAPLVGRTGGLITAPCAPAAAVLAAVAHDLSAQSTPPDRIVTLLGITALISSLAQILYGSIRAGRLIKFIPYQVVSGYLSGVALIIASAQIPKLLGTPKEMGFLEAAMAPSTWRWPGIVVGGVTLTVMIVAPKVTSKVPGAILGLVAGIGTYFGLATVLPELLVLEGNRYVIGKVASGSFVGAALERFSGLSTLSLDEVRSVVAPGLTLSVLLSIDTLKTGVVLDALTRTRSNSDRELIGQGAANVASFLVAGFPGAGTTGPTLVNVTSGARSIESGVISGLFVLVLYTALGSLVAWVPIGALAGILLGIALRMFDFKMFRLLATRSTRLDFVMIAVVVVVAEGVGLIQASLVGVFLAILLFIRDQVRGSVIIRKGSIVVVRSTRRRSREEDGVLKELGDLGVFVQLRGNLFFGTTDQLFSELEGDLENCRYLLLDLRRVGSMDYTAANLLRQMHQRLAERGGELLLAGMPSSAPIGRNIEKYLRSLGLVNDEGGIRIFDTRDGALEWMEGKILEAANLKPEDDRSLELTEIPPLAGLEPEALGPIASAVRSLSLRKGEMLFRRGDPGNQLFLVRRGHIHVLLPLEGGQRHRLATIGRGEFLGEIAFLDGTTRTADAEAGTDAELFVVSRETLDALTGAHLEIASHVYRELGRAVSARLRAADTELRVLEER